MIAAVCFRCGEEKQSPLLACRGCGEKPKHESTLALSVVLSEHLSTRAQLAHFAYEIRNRLKISTPVAKLAEAREALKDSRIVALLGGADQSESATASGSSNGTDGQRSVSRSPVERALKTSILHKSPFALLGVNNRDDRRKVVEQAEQKSLELNHDDCQKARGELTNPRTRLSAEIAWLPGVSPRKASHLLDSLLRDPMSIRVESGIPTLAHCNLMAAAFDIVNSSDPAADVAAFIQEMAGLVDALDVDEIIRDVNEDRFVSGFPEIKTIDQIEAELSERKRHFKIVIRNALDRLPPTALLDAITLAVDGATNGGNSHAPELIDELVDSYAVEVQSVLAKEAENVQKLIRAARDAVSAGEDSVKALVEKIESVARNWDRFAQPIQLSAKARGIDHDQSRGLALSIRSLAIDLFNDYDMLTLSQRLTGLLQELFAELPEVSERASEDATTLTEIQTKRKHAESHAKKQEEEWAREIAYTADVGMVFKETLSISSAGIDWKGKRYALESITAVRWGSVRHSVNGIPTGTDYQIAFATRQGSTIINLKKESTYAGFLNSLWRAVCIRLMIEMSEALKEGNSLSFGDMTVEDSSVVLVRHKWLGANERVRLPWSDVHVWSADGEFIIGAKNDKKIYGSTSYMNHWNTHLLDHVVRGGFKKGISRLSEYLGD